VEQNAKPKWKTAGKLNMTEVAQRLKTKGWKITSIEASLEENPDIQIIIPTPILLQENDERLTEILRLAETQGKQLIEEYEIQQTPGGKNGPTVH
jgi:hypothetical protein